MKKHQDSSVRRLPGPAIWPLCEGDQTPEAHHELFRDWQRTQTQSSAKAPRSPRQQMDVWFCGEQEPPAERHTCATANPDLIDCALSQARQGHPCFSIDFDLHRWPSAAALFGSAIVSMLVSGFVMQRIEGKDNDGLGPADGGGGR